MNAVAAVFLADINEVSECKRKCSTGSIAWYHHPRLMAPDSNKSLVSITLKVSLLLSLYKHNY